MTIRYTCSGCESVLKIKDEKAGSKGKCPKCKLEFLVPQPETQDSDPEIEETAAADEPADLVDMPIELTPDVPESAGFDPLDILTGPMTSGSRPPSGSPGRAASPSSERRASVADMMKDFEASKKKDRDKKSGSEGSRPSVSSVAETTGSAADALSRAYQQKRDAASSPSYNAKNAKSAEQRALMMDFIKTRAAPGILLVGLLVYSYLWWMNRELYTGLPLYEVSGQVLRNGAPAPNIRIIFEPSVADPNDPRGAVMGNCDNEGKFRLMSTPTFPGAPAGEYKVSMMDENGLPIARSQGLLILSVSEKDKNEFKIDL